MHNLQQVGESTSLEYLESFLDHQGMYAVLLGLETFLLIIHELQVYLSTTDTEA